MPRPSRLPRAAVALAALVWAVPCAAAAHGSHEANALGGRASGTALPEAQREYYLDFYSVVARLCALPEWSLLLDAVAQLSHNTYTSSEAGGLYQVVTARLPVVSTSWAGGQASLLSAPPLTLTRGLDRGLVVEVRNDTGAAVTLQGVSAGGPASNSAAIPPGETRALLVEVVGPPSPAASVELRLSAGAVSRVLDVPVTVVAPAFLVGATMDADLGLAYPGRVWVQGSDGELRHLEEFASNSTLSLKKIPGSSPWCEGCTNGNREYELPFSYSRGRFRVRVPPGATAVTLERGFEHDRVTVDLALAPGEARSISLESGRFIDMKSLGWVSGETHVHWVKNWWTENEDLDLLRVVQKAEDVRVVNNLTLRGLSGASVEFVKPDHAPMGPVPGLAGEVGEYLVQMGEEFRNDPFYGHLSFLNLIGSASFGWTPGSSWLALESGLIRPISTGDLLGPFAEDYPMNHAAADRAHGQNPPSSSPIVVASHGLVGPYSGEVPVDVVLGRIDSVDQVDPADYYRILDCGLRLPLTDGADHPARLVGATRCYAKLDGPFTYGNWIEGIARGATFITSGPLLVMTVNGAPLGSEVAVDTGEEYVVRLFARSRGPLGRIQVVSNGQVLFDQSYAVRSADVTLTLTADVSRWIAARCSSGASPTFRPLDEVGAAHTSATYLIVDGEDIFVDSGAAEYLRDVCRQGGDDVYANGTFFAPAAALKRREARDYFYAGRDAYQAILDAR